MSTLGTVIGRGLLSARPAASIAGELYYATDTDILYRDSGSAWQAVSMGGGTSFPGSPATNDRFYRTDLELEAYYDGTRWLTTTRYHLVIPINGTNAGGDVFSGTNGAAYRAPLWNAVFNLWLVDFYGITFVASGSTGSAGWTCALLKETQGAAYASSSIASFSTHTAPDTNAQFTPHTVAINALIGTGYGSVIVSITKVSTPGNLTAAFGMTYRLVLT